MELLLRHEDRGYPTEYFISRIRGRRAHLLKDWDGVLFSANILEYLQSTRYRELIADYAKEGIWKHTLKEFHWAYNQMNHGLQDTFRPFFMYAEMKTLIICFRHKMHKTTEPEIENLLSYSLLSDKIKNVLKAEPDLTALFEIFEKKSFFPSTEFPELRKVFLKEGLKGTEKYIAGTLLEYIMETGLHPVMRKFFTTIIDIKNILAVYKHLRWSITTDPLFISGGSLRESSIKKLMESDEISGITRLVYQVTGMNIEEPQESSIETLLLIGLTKKVRLFERTGPEIGFILGYLWKCYLEALNLNIVLYGRDIERDILKKKLIQ
jgi:vacuolar-type H+-ATPase subunit C/Vma6